MGVLNVMNNKFQSILKRANLNYKKELLIVILINLAAIALMIVTFLLTHLKLIFIPFIFLIVLVNAITFYRYIFLYSKSISGQIKEFTYLFRYLYIEVNHGVKVKDALFNLKEKASLTMNKRLEKLFEEINNDTSLVPYLNFASTFSSVLVEEVMLNLYRLAKKDDKDNLLHFNEAYLKLKKIIEKEEMKDSNRSYEFIKTTALIGTAIIIIVVIAVTIIFVEEYIHG